MNGAIAIKILLFEAVTRLFPTVNGNFANYSSINIRNSLGESRSSLSQTVASTHSRVAASLAASSAGASWSSAIFAAAA
jgi:hypothetical protein